MPEEIREIKEQLGELRRQLREVESKVSLTSISLRDTLKRRGFRYGGDNPLDNVILPANLTPESEDEFYELMKKYSFRIVLRDIINKKDNFKKGDLLRYCSPEVVERYLDFLKREGLIKEKEGGTSFRLVKETVNNFGSTLEWFVAKAFQREFSSEASWGVKLLDTSFGGDYDVIARVERAIAYIEVKSSPPKHIEVGEIREFMGRVEELLPNLAIFLVDTELRLEDKIVKMFEEIGFKMEKIYNNIYRTRRNVFVTSSKPELISNLGQCLKYYFGVVEQSSYHSERS